MSLFLHMFLVRTILFYSKLIRVKGNIHNINNVFNINDLHFPLMKKIKHEYHKTAAGTSNKTKHNTEESNSNIVNHTKAKISPIKLEQSNEGHNLRRDESKQCT